MTRAVVIDGHRAFRAALDALARPGMRVPYAGDAAGLVAAIFEPTEPILRVPDEDPAPVDPSQARVVIVDGPSSGGVLTRLPRGSAEAPEAGATALFELDDDQPRTEVLLRGPGVDDERRCTLPLATGEILARNEACAAWPLGVELLVVAGGTIVGLPRGTRVEVVG